MKNIKNGNSGGRMRENKKTYKEKTTARIKIERNEIKDETLETLRTLLSWR